MDNYHPIVSLNNGTLEPPAGNDPPTVEADFRSSSIPFVRLVMPHIIEIKEEPQSPEFLEEDFGNNGIFCFDKEVPSNTDESSESFAAPLLRATLTQNQLIQNESANFHGMSGNIYNGAFPLREPVNYDRQNGLHATSTREPSPLPAFTSAGVRCFDIVEKTLSKSLREQFETYYNESMDYTDNTPIGSLWEIYKGIRALVEEETNSPHRSIYSNVETEVPKQKTCRRKTTTKAKYKTKFAAKSTVAEKYSSKLISATRTSPDCRSNMSNEFSNTDSIQCDSSQVDKSSNFVHRSQGIIRSLNFKIEILNRKGESATKLGREYNVSEATIRGYRRNELKIRDEYAKKYKIMENSNQPIKKEPLGSSDEIESSYGQKQNHLKKSGANEPTLAATHKLPKRKVPLRRTLPTERSVADTQPKGRRRRFYSLDTKLRILARKDATIAALAREFGMPEKSVFTIRRNEAKIMKMAGSPLKTQNIPKIKEENPSPLIKPQPLPRRKAKVTKPNYYKGKKRNTRPREDCSLELKLEILSRKRIASDILSKEYGLQHYTIENIKKSGRQILERYNKVTQKNSIEKHIKQEKRSDDENCDPNYQPFRRKRKKKPSLKMRTECSEACAPRLTKTISGPYESPSLETKIDVLNLKGLSYRALAKEFGLTLKEVTRIKKCERYLRDKYAKLQKENKRLESGCVSALKRKKPGPLPVGKNSSFSAKSADNKSLKMQFSHRKNRRSTFTRKHQKPKFNPVPAKRKSKSFLSLEQKIEVLNRRKEPFENLAKDYGITKDDFISIKKSSAYYRMRYSKLMESKSNGDIKMGEAIQVKTEPMVSLASNSDVTKLIGQKTWSQYCQENRHKIQYPEKKRPLEQDNNFVGFPDMAEDLKAQDCRFAKRVKTQRELGNSRRTRNSSPKNASDVSTKFDKIMYKPVVILEKINLKEVQLSLLNKCRKVDGRDDEQTVKEKETSDGEEGKVEEEKVKENEEKLGKVSKSLQKNLEEKETPQGNEESEGKIEDEGNVSSDEIEECREKTKVNKEIYKNKENVEGDEEMSERNEEIGETDQEINERDSETDEGCEEKVEEDGQKVDGDSCSFEGFEKQASPLVLNSVSYKVNRAVDAYCDKNLTTTDMIDEYLKINEESFPHLDVPENSIVDSLNLASNCSSNESQINKQCSNLKVRNNETDLQFSLWDYVSRSGSNAGCNHSTSSGSQCLECSYKCDSDVSLQNRVETHPENESFKCSYCNYSCSDNYFLRFHELNHHSTQISEC